MALARSGTVYEVYSVKDVIPYRWALVGAPRIGKTTAMVLRQAIGSPFHFDNSTDGGKMIMAWPSMPFYALVRVLTDGLAMRRWGR